MKACVGQFLGELLAFIGKTAKYFFNSVLSMNGLIQDSLRLKFDCYCTALDFALASEAFFIEFAEKICFSLVEFR